MRELRQPGGLDEASIMHDPTSQRGATNTSHLVVTGNRAGTGDEPTHDAPQRRVVRGKGRYTKTSASIATSPKSSRSVSATASTLLSTRT